MLVGNKYSHMRRKSIPRIRNLQGIPWVVQKEIGEVYGERYWIKKKTNEYKKTEMTTKHKPNKNPSACKMGTG